MPYRSEKVKIAGTKYDRRRKLTDEQVRAIKLLKNEGYSFRWLAEMFHCSKWSVQSIVKPQKRGVIKKYPTEYWTAKKREYRQRKQALFKSGQIHEKSNRRRTRRHRVIHQVDSDDERT